jgi:hypothetical protein
MSAYFFFLGDMRGKVKADQPDIKVIGAERHLSACFLGCFQQHQHSSLDAVSSEQSVQAVKGQPCGHAPHPVPERPACSLACTPA